MIQLNGNHFAFLLLSVCERLLSRLGWLRKLWEVVSDGGVVVFSSEVWNAERIRPFIEQWLAELTALGPCDYTCVV